MNERALFASSMQPQAKVDKALSFLSSRSANTKLLKKKKKLLGPVRPGRLDAG